MHITKPHLISSLFVLTFFFVSCSNFNSNDNQAQITINLGNSSRVSANQQDNIDHFELKYIRLPDKFIGLFELFKNKEGHEEEVYNDPWYQEYLQYMNNLKEKDFSSETFKKNSTIRIYVNPGMWALELYADDSSNKHLYVSHCTVDLRAGDNCTLNLKMYSCYNFSDGVYYDTYIYRFNSANWDPAAIFDFYFKPDTNNYDGNTFFRYSRIKIPEGVTCLEWEGEYTIQDDIKASLANAFNLESFNSLHSLNENFISDLNSGQSFQDFYSAINNESLQTEIFYSQAPYVDNNNVLHFLSSVPKDMNDSQRIRRVEFPLHFSDGTIIMVTTYHFTGQA